MAGITQTTNCIYCGTKDSVTVITKQTKHSRSVKVMNCTHCKVQNGVYQTLKKDRL